MSWKDDCYKIMIGVVAVAFVFVLGVFGIKSFKSSEFYAKESSAEYIYAGEIVNKRIINTEQALYTSTNMDYRLEILYEFEHNGETKIATKSISVERDIYEKAEIGMWFDAQALSLAAPQNNKNEEGSQ